MPLYGLDRPPAKPVGGVVSVGLIAASDFPGATCDTAGGCFTDIPAIPSFAEYAFREDRAVYAEEYAGNQGQPLVRHTLTMEFPGGEQTRRAVDGLFAASRDGFIAVVATGEGERLLAGYSVAFGAAYPLRIAKVSMTSASRPSDFPAATIVLESEDTETSKPIGE